MRRDLGLLTTRAHDLLVVGAGVHGAAVAWDAALRGLDVAVVDAGDVGAATSANSLRIAHGGLRYLARGDVRRMRESIAERSTLMRIAPGLVVPLPVLVPTRGGGVEGRAAMRLALAMNDLASTDRNRGLDAEHRLPPGRVLSRAEAVRLFPPLDKPGVTGGALWHDARFRSAERLTLAFVRSAAELGAAAANYVRLDRLSRGSGDRLEAYATDLRTGSPVRIRAGAVVVAAGHRTASVVAHATERPAPAEVPPRTAAALNLMVGRPLAPVAVGVRALSGREEDPVIGGRRYLFLTPQEGSTLVGTWYGVDRGEDPRELAERGADRLLREIGESCPALGLTPADVSRVQLGWLPLKAGLEPGRADALADRTRVLDHGASGWPRLFSVEGVKYTTARRVAEQALDRIVARLGARAAPCRTTRTPLTGAWTVPADDPALAARIHEAVREEMAVTLADIVYRRTALGEPPGPSREAVVAAGRIAAADLGWNDASLLGEVDDVMRQAAGPAAGARLVTA